VQPGTPLRKRPCAPFEDVWTRSEVTELDGHRIHIACIADLVALKRIAGRPKDQEDIAALEAIAKRKAP
jgi:predicted nucleotidyltransferase